MTTATRATMGSEHAEQVALVQWAAWKQGAAVGAERAMEGRSVMAETLKAPFPYFGGKSRIAAAVWERFGRVNNFVEPFFGSGAVLLACPHPGHTETVNDADGLLCNFWRALRADPDAVAEHADYPVSELDLHARHRWLVAQRADVERLLTEPDWYDAKIAGWWVWGINNKVGGGWGAEDVAMGLPYLSRPNFGENRTSAALQRLAARLRQVRIVCGDFERVLSAACTTRHGTTAVFLDPPYDLAQRASVYAVETDAAHRAREWAIENGDNPLLRIALCGYDGEHAMPDGWKPLRWKAAGGYGSQADGRGRENAARECVWFSPHCLDFDALPMFAAMGVA